MHLCRLAKRFYTIFFGFVIAVLIFSCSQTPSQQQQSSNETQIRSLLRSADSLNAAGNLQQATLALNQARRQITVNDPIVTDFYCLLSKWQFQASLKSNYADSAMAVFNTESHKKQYPNQYYKALLAKGEAFISLKQYNRALQFYYDSRKIFTVGNCEDGYLSARMAGIYFNQQNFKLAAKLWAESARLMSRCQGSTSYQMHFYTLQGYLNSAGVSFEKAGQLDSALYYYHEDVELIKEAHNKKLNTNPASVVVYDNLGGVSLKQGHLDKALQYLTQSISTPVNEVDGIKIPPHIKLAQLYLQTKDYGKAFTSLQQAQIRLKKFSNNLDLEVLWSKTYARYLYQTQRPAPAYQELSRYIELKDSLEKSSIDLYRLNVDRELGAMYQQQEFTDLSTQSKFRQLYMIGSIVVALMAIAIVILIYRNL